MLDSRRSAVANGCEVLVVKALLKAYPDGIKHVDSGGHTLLHQAACNAQSEQTVALLLSAWPEAAAMRDVDGNTPLHFAAGCKAPSTVVQALLTNKHRPTFEADFTESLFMSSF